MKADSSLVQKFTPSAWSRVLNRTSAVIVALDAEK
jgi:hypothetical protein